MVGIAAGGGDSLAVLILRAGCLAPAQKPLALNSFVIDANRPYFYLKFDHLGQGVPRNEDETAPLVQVREKFQGADFD